MAARLQSLLQEIARLERLREATAADREAVAEINRQFDHLYNLRGDVNLEEEEVESLKLPEPLAEEIDEPMATAVNSPSNPPAAWWEARWKLWKPVKAEVVEALDGPLRVQLRANQRQHRPVVAHQEGLAGGEPAVEDRPEAYAAVLQKMMQFGPRGERNSDHAASFTMVGAAE